MMTKFMVKTESIFRVRGVFFHRVAGCMANLFVIPTVFTALKQFDWNLSLRINYDCNV